MKLRIFCLLLLIANSHAIIKAQDYLISFIGSGSATEVTSVKVENLTRGTSLTMSGTNILHLLNSITGISEVIRNDESEIRFSPNPMSEYTKMQFYLPEDGEVNIALYDITGKCLYQSSDHLSKGRQVYNIQGVEDGLHVITIRSKSYSATGRFLGNDRNSGRVKIEYESTIATQFEDNTTEKMDPTYSTKGLNEEVLMQYNSGDRLRFTATSGNYLTVLTEILTESKLLTFDFFPCTDDDGKNYPVVTIGTQIWMAENLAYLPSVSPSSIGSNTEKHYYVYGYQGTDVNEAKATINYSTYGVLYNWPAAMNGQASSSTNPSGVKGVCPSGWHLPSHAEWQKLVDYLADNGFGFEGSGDDIAKALAANTHWNYFSQQGTPGNDLSTNNSTGFSGFPSGARGSDGEFYMITEYAPWWASETYINNPTYGGMWRLVEYATVLYKIQNPMENGQGVRCIKDQSKIEQAFPGIEGELTKVLFDEDTIKCKLVDSLYIFQGDIVFTRDQINPMKGASISNMSRWWPDGIVYYSIDNNMPQRTIDLIDSAIADYEKNTVIRFVERTIQPGYVEIKNSEEAIINRGTSSNLGYTGKKQDIWLEPSWNTKGEILHEIGLTLGLVHEQSRPDRDNYIVINWDNILESKYDQYEIYEKKHGKTSVYGKFDFNSIMLYHSTNSNNAIDPSIPVIVKLIDGETYTANRSGLSESDIDVINLIYSKTGTVIDVAGNIYRTVKIGEQWWMAENLAYLPKVFPPDSGSSEVPLYYVKNYYGSDVNQAKNTDEYKTYGALYNWPAAKISCPINWRLPTENEWENLAQYISFTMGPYEKTGDSWPIGQHLKNISGWIPLPLSTDDFGFSALPGGYRDTFTYNPQGDFDNFGMQTYWWTSTYRFAWQIWCRFLFDESITLSSVDHFFDSGLSVRCIKDN